MKKAIIEGVAEHRKLRGLSRFDVCTVAQLSDKTLIRMEQGQKVGLPICERVAKVLKMPMSAIREVA